MEITVFSDVWVTPVKASLTPQRVVENHCSKPTNPYFMRKGIDYTKEGLRVGNVVLPKEFWCNFTKNRIVNIEQGKVTGSFMIRLESCKS